MTDRTRLSESPAFRELSGKYLSDESQLLLVDLEAVRGFVRRHAELFGSEPRDAEADAGSADAPVPVYQPDSQIVDVLGLFDAAFAAVRFEEDRIRLVAGAVLLPAAREADSGSARRN